MSGLIEHRVAAIAQTVAHHCPAFVNAFADAFGATDDCAGHGSFAGTVVTDYGPDRAAEHGASNCAGGRFLRHGNLIGIFTAVGKVDTINHRIYPSHIDDRATSI